MTDKKTTEELNDKDLDQVTGGGFMDNIKQTVRTPSTSPRLRKDPLNMEVVNEDE
ncbi:MAG: bacteriocin [Polymorphobacter sp.]|uniref:bacteriocin n=1 Tax=Polymorphobacter sp. TaxID=1909290 RepID=UPI003A83A7BB